MSININKSASSITAPPSLSISNNSSSPNVNIEANKDDKEHALFTNFSKKQASGNSLTYEMAFFPIIVWVNTEILNYIFEDLAFREKKVLSEFLGTGSLASQCDIELAFYLALHHFQETGNSEQVIQFLETGKTVILKYNLGSGKDFELYNSAIELFKTKRLDLFKKNILCFAGSTKEIQLSSKQNIVLAMNSLERVAKDIIRLTAVSSHAFELHQKKLNRSDDSITPPAMNSPIQSHCDVLSEYAFLSKETVSIIKKAFREAFFKYSTQSANFKEICRHDLRDDLMTRYAKVIDYQFAHLNNKQIDTVGAMSVQTRNKIINLPTKYDFTIPGNCVAYYNENIKIYQNFLPHIKEVCGLLFPITQELKEICTILKDFHLYLRFGNLEKLQLRLDQEIHSSPDQLQKIVLEEVLSFSKNLSTDRTLLLKILSLFKQPEMKELYQFRHFFSIQESYYTTFLNLRKFLLEANIDFAEPYFNQIPVYLQKIEQETKSAQKNLLGSDSKSTKKSKKKEPLTSEKQTAVTKKDLNNNSISELPSLEEIPSSSVAPLHKTEKTVLTPFQSLQHTREKVKESFTSLSVNCSSYGTKEAILNAQSHYDELLCIMRRFLENSKHPLSRQTISTFIIHCIQHGFLGAEQMLSALEREGNQIADRNELNMILNHDLIRILINCPLEAGPIPQNLREWIRYARLGEYWLRDLNACEVGNPSVQNLLAKLKLFAESNNAFTAENLIEEALGFAEKSALLCENLQLQIDALKTQPSAQQKQLAQSFKKSFRSACQSVSNACTHLSITSEKSSLSSNPVKELIEKIRKTTLPNTIAYTLFDIASNHLPHLEAELQSQLYLNPFEARLHLRTVLRLNQHIVEKVLRALLSEYQPERNFRLEEHDLSVMVLALGMDQIDFSQEEWDWLNAGKMIHQMTRYLESYNSTQTNRKTDLVKKVEKTFYGADEIAQKQSMDNHYGLDQGFTIADKEISYKLDAVKDLAKDDLALMHSILDKIFSKVIR